MSIEGRNYRNRRPDMEDGITLTNDVQQVREGDYVSEEDGLLYCGKCGRPKQIRITVNGSAKVQNCRCGCAEEEGAEENDVPPTPGPLRRYPLCTFRHVRKGGLQTSLDCFTAYADHWEDMKRTGLGLLLTGEAGFGKTFYAACIGNALKERGVGVTMVPVSELIQVMRALDGDRQSRVRRTLEQEDLLILDDLWMETLDPWDTELLLAVLGCRDLNRRPTIITSRQDLRHYIPEGPGSNRRRQLAELLCRNCHIPLMIPDPEARWEADQERKDLRLELADLYSRGNTRFVKDMLEKYRMLWKEDEDAG
jgi:DNA replication protein DnaC